MQARSSVVLTIAVWRRIHERGGRFARVMEEEVVWVVGAANAFRDPACADARPPTRNRSPAATHANEPAQAQ